MSSYLSMQVFFHEGIYRGNGDWPPSPFRLFQALVAGISPRKENLSTAESDALRWLETLSPPTIIAPREILGNLVRFFMPNNEIDKISSNIKEFNEARAKTKREKVIGSKIFDKAEPIIYNWKLSEHDMKSDHIQNICKISEKLFQLGAGVDMAWAYADIIDASELESLYRSHNGKIYSPATSRSAAGKIRLQCPMESSFENLIERYFAKRQSKSKASKSVNDVYTQPPQGLFKSLPYEALPNVLVFDLCKRNSEGKFEICSIAQTNEVPLVENIRDSVIRKFDDAGLDIDLTERIIKGSKGANGGEFRIRIVPLPSIGHVHADHRIRRVMIIIPPDCPLPLEDLEWAFSGLNLNDGIKRDIVPTLVTSESNKMGRHYGINNPERIWRSVTPVVLPMKYSKASGRTERIVLEENAVRIALMHAKIHSKVQSIRIQREPFDLNGVMSREFVKGTRFHPSSARYVEISFHDSVSGPIVIGNGRYLGLGIMAPV